MKSFAALRLGGLALRRCRPDGAEMVLVSGSINMPRLTVLWGGTSRRCQMQFGLDERGNWRLNVSTA
jgi:hypothetical protein